jgi:antitoxin component YwqK of YwqJK toxin-antitoxin module
MVLRLLLLFCLFSGYATNLSAQDDLALLKQDEFSMLEDSSDDLLAELNSYDRFNTILGGDSVRYCNGYPCSGWVEDRYTDGTLKHRGMYTDGRLVVYRNYRADGVLERDFRALDAVKHQLRTYHPNSTLRSEARYADGVSFQYEDHYMNGALRYAEERHRKEPYFIRMDLYSAKGEPISLLRLVDRKRVQFELTEYHPGGALRSIGRAQYDQRRMDTQRIGTWKHYFPDGTLEREEDYVDGKVHAVR